MKHTALSVTYEYAKRNLELLVWEGINIPMPRDEEIHIALYQLRHFAKQGVKVRLK